MSGVMMPTAMDILKKKTLKKKGFQEFYKPYKEGLKLFKL